jgi:hypothetical protein
MRKNIAVACFLLLSLAESEGGSGKYAGEFLAIGVGGRALGMGGAAVALTGDVTAGFWNPAGLARIDYPQFVLMHNEQFGSLLNHDYGAVAIPFGPSTTLGLSIIRLGTDDVARTTGAGLDAAGNLTTDINLFSRVDPNRVVYFNASDWAFIFTYARRVSPDLTYGANLKVIRRDLDENSATGLGLDVGVWYVPMDGLMLGAAVQDISTTFLAWDTGVTEFITPTAKLGGAYQFTGLGGTIVPAVDVDLRFENRRSASMFHVGGISADLHAGLEYRFASLVSLRAGYSDVKQLTLGAGVHLPRLSIDYSFAKFGGERGIDDSHRISLIFTLESESFKRPSEYCVPCASRSSSSQAFCWRPAAAPPSLLLEFFTPPTRPPGTEFSATGSPRDGST